MKRAIDWPEVTRAYRVRTCTLEEFAEQRGISPATLRYHLHKERKTKPGTFFPVSVAAQKNSSEEVVIEFTSGLRLSIRG